MRHPAGKHVMAGRPPASYAYPRLWLHLGDLGYLPNSRALKNIRDKHGKNLRFGTTFSNSLLEEKFRPQLPRLVDQDTACDLVELVSRALKAAGQPVLVVSKEVVQFDHQIEGLVSFLMGSAGSQSDAVEALALAAGVQPCVILAAAAGKLLPGPLCADIVKATFAANLGGTHSAASAVRIVQVSPGRGAAPANRPDELISVLGSLSAKNW